MPFERLADNLARIRKVRDLSQEQLALAAGVGVDTVARIEQGRRTTCRPETLRNLALALEVNEEALLGHEPSERTAALDISSLRVSITAGDLLPDAGDFAEAAETIGLDAMAVTCHTAWRAYVDGRHAPLLDMLPGVLVDARRIVQSTSDVEKARANRLLSTAYRLAAGMAGRLGHPDLAWSAGEHALRAAAESDDPSLGVAISLRYLAWVLVRQRRFEEAQRVAVAAAERIQPAMLDRDPKRAGVYGNLLFNAASAALFAGRVQYAEDLLHEAQAAATRAGAGYADEAAIFGPRVAAIQRIELQPTLTIQSRCYGLHKPFQQVPAKRRPSGKRGIDFDWLPPRPNAAATETRSLTSPKRVNSRPTGPATNHSAPRPCANSLTARPVAADPTSRS